MWKNYRFLRYTRGEMIISTGKLWSQPADKGRTAVVSLQQVLYNIRVRNCIYMFRCVCTTKKITSCMIEDIRLGVSKDQSPKEESFRDDKTACPVYFFLRNECERDGMLGYVKNIVTRIVSSSFVILSTL